MPLKDQIYYQAHNGEDGGKPPMILIHGAGGTHLHWPAEMRRLPGQRVFAIDLPGHGKSEGRGHQTIDAYVNGILGWLDAMNMFSAIFIGHSMGGAIALTLADQHPERVLGLGLVGSGARLRVAPAILENAANPATFPLAVEAIISWAFSPQTDQRLIKLAQNRMLETRPSVLHGDFSACNNFDMMTSIHKIQVPTLIVCGQDDQLTPLRYSQYLTDQIPKAQLTAIPDAGHMVMLEKTSPVVEAVNDFVTQVPFRPGHSTS